jgi:hypothetical protein
MRRTPRPLAAVAVAAVVAAAGAGCGRTENGRGMNTTASAGKSAAANQSEGAIPRSGDLCGGTSGNGQIVRIGRDAFTIQRNDDGTSQSFTLQAGQPSKRQSALFLCPIWR